LATHLDGIVLIPKACGNQPHNAAGFLHNNRYSFKELYSRHKEYLSFGNRLNLKSGLAPVVDEQGILHHPEHANFLDDILVHHHLGKGSMEFPE
jgi:hypothetical protein